jgi:hypothetical protein
MVVPLGSHGVHVAAEERILRSQCPYHLDYARSMKVLIPFLF